MKYVIMDSTTGLFLHAVRGACYLTWVKEPLHALQFDRDHRAKITTICEIFGFKRTELYQLKPEHIRPE